jgi:hypothetical protein
MDGVAAKETETLIVKLVGFQGNCDLSRPTAADAATFANLVFRAIALKLKISNAVTKNGLAGHLHQAAEYSEDGSVADFIHRFLKSVAAAES